MNRAVSLAIAVNLLALPAFADGHAASAGDIMEDMAAQTDALAVTKDDQGHVDGMVMLSDVLFPYAEASLAPAALKTLASIAEQLDGITALEIVGHTDSIGSTEFNLRLGQRRAETVLNWLVTEGAMDPEALTATSAGESTPVAANTLDTGEDNPEGRAKNRRVAFKIVAAPVAEGEAEIPSAQVQDEIENQVEAPVAQAKIETRSETEASSFDMAETAPLERPNTVY